MNKKITEFYNLLLENQDEMTVLEEKLSKISSEEDFKELVAREIIPMAKAKGFDFTEEDLLNYEKEMLEKLSEEELVGVSGGVSLMNKKVLSLFLAGISLAGNIQSTQAVVTRDAIMKSTGKIVGEESVGQSQQEGTGEEARQQEEKPKMSGEQVMRAQSQQLESIDNKEEIDVPYILDALNLVDPYIFNLSGTTEKFRFFDGYKQKISTQAKITAADGIPSWDYNKDEGVGSPNFMRCLFPSSSGSLNVAGGARNLEKFSQDCKPTPELVAQIIGYIHNHIRNENEAAARDLNGLMEKFDQGKAEQFLENYLNIPRVKGNRKGKVYLRTVLYLLKNAETMIKEQESDGQNPEKILPKYMPERMLMSYFILNFNEEKEVNAFYTEAKRVIKTKSNVNQSEIDKSKERLSKVTELLGMIKQKENSPYRERTQQHKSAKLIERDDNSGKVKFSSSTFPDCADIAVRHIINLLSYNEKDSWNFIVDVKDKSLEEELKKILDRMQNDVGEFEFNSLKERVKLFFYYQAKHPQGADAVDLETRSLWNYVISNMSKNEGGMYKLQYSRNGNELEPGYLNMLKAIYNIVYALKHEDAEFDKKLLDAARESIDNLGKAIEANKTGDDLKGALCTAINKTFGLISVIGETEVDSDDVNIYGTDCFGTVKVNDFVISQKAGHASVDFNPVLTENFKEDDPLKEFLIEDSTTQLLSRTFHCGIKRDDIMTRFNYLFYIGDYRREYDTMFFKNFAALNFLKEFQGEGDNRQRIVNSIKEYYILSDIKVFDELKKRVTTLSDCIFKNYITINSKQFREWVSHVNLSEVYKDYEGDEIFEKDGLRFCFSIDRDKKVTIYPLADNGVKDLKIPSSISFKGENYDVSRIGTCALLNNETLETVTIENGVQNLTVEKGAFKGCNIKEFNIPDSMKELKIEEEAFQGSGVRKFEVPQSVEKLIIQERAFENAQLLTEFNISTSGQNLNIGQKAFANSGIKEFNLSVNMENLILGRYEFSGMNSLSKFNVSGNIGKLVVGGSVFREMKSLEEFNISADVRELEIESKAFWGSGIKRFQVPEKIEKLTLELWAFYSTSFLEEFNVPGRAKELKIGVNAFYKSGIKKFVAPKGVEKLIIRRGAFCFAESLREFILPASDEVVVEGNPFRGSSIDESNIPAVIREKIE